MKRIFALLLALLIPAAAFAGTPKEYVGPFRFEMEVETVQFGRYDQDNDPEDGMPFARTPDRLVIDGLKVIVQHDAGRVHFLRRFGFVF